MEKTCKNSEAVLADQTDFNADVVIIGAGISGIGIARALSAKGLTSVLVDPAEPASLTSDNSLRIIHGGIRYLQNLDFQRSLKSIKAQHKLLNEYPELIKELSCFMPLSLFGLKSFLPMQAGSLLFKSLLSKADSTVKPPKVLSKELVPEEIRKIHPEASHFFNWFDAQLIDQRKLAETELSKIREKSAFVRDLVVKVSRTASCFMTTLARGPLIKSKSVINAAALGGTSIEFENIKTQHLHNWAQAFNLVFAKKVPFDQAVTIRSAEGREYFIVPRNKQTEPEIAIGTFYFPLDREVSDNEINKLVSSLTALLPSLNLTIQDFKYPESGELPCSEKFSSERSILKNDLIYQDEAYLQVYTPKYTTYQIFGEQVAQRVVEAIS